MQNRTENMPSFSLIHFSEAKKELEKTLFTKSATNLVDAIYLAAKNKDKATLEKIFNYKVKILSSLYKEKGEADVTLFNTRLHINGRTPLYWVAKRALASHAPDVIDFIVTHFPNLSKKSFVFAYAEHNDVEHVNQFLNAPSDDHALLHAAIMGYQLSDNTREIAQLTHAYALKLPHDMQAIANPFWPYVFQALQDVNSIFLSKAILFFLKEEHIAYADLVKHFNYDKKLSKQEKMLIQMLAAYYNHHQLLQKLLTPAYFEELQTQETTQLKDHCLLAAIAGGSYEAICVLFTLNCRIDEAISNALFIEDHFLASKLINVGLQASLSKKTPPMKAAAPAIKNKSGIKSQLKNCLNEIISLIDTANIALLKENNDINFFLKNSVPNKKNDAHGIKKIWHVIFEILVSKKIVDVNARANRLKNILQVYLTLFDTYSLSDLLNKPLIELSPVNSLNMQSTANLLQLIANHPHERFVYLDFFLTYNPNILPFASSTALTQSATLITSSTTPVQTLHTIRPLSVFVINPALSLPVIMRHPALLDVLDTHILFSEDFPCNKSSHEELKIEAATSLAIQFLSHSEESAAFFLDKYTKQMQAHISNPFLLFALLNKQVGKQWFKQHLHLLKDIPVICYEFANLGHSFVSEEKLFNVISKDMRLINALPKKYRDQLIQKKNAHQEANKKILAQSVVKYEKSSNQQKIIITPTASEPLDVASIQAKNFDAILAHQHPHPQNKVNNNMKNKNQSTAAYSLVTLPNVKKEIGEELFEQASTDLVSAIYQAAKEKNEALLSNILEYEVRIDSDIASRTKVLIAKLFNIQININGHDPIYLLARKALRAQEPEVIDFLFTHIPDIKKKYIVLAYAEANNVAQVNALLQKSDDLASRHLAILGYQLAGNTKEMANLTGAIQLNLSQDIQTIIASLWRCQFTSFDHVSPVFLSKALLFFLKNEHISRQDLVTHFNYDQGISKTEELTIHIMLSFYNHYPLLQTLITPNYFDKFGPIEERSHKDNCISASVLGGSYDVACVLLALGCDFYDFVSRTVKNQNFLFASKFIALNQQASYFKKTPPIKNNIPALNESQTKEQFKTALNEIIDFTQEISTILLAENKPLAIQAFNKRLHEKEMTAVSKNILRILFDLLITKNNIFVHQETIKLKNIIYACLPLFDSHSLLDVLNKPVSELLPSNKLELKCESSLFQHIAGSYVSYYIYLGYVLSHTTDIMYFVKQDTLTKATIVTTQYPIALPLISLFAMHPLSIIPTFTKYPPLLQAIEAKHIFSESSFFIEEKNEELGIESASSIALSFLESSEDVVAFFLEHYSKQMENHVSNPFLLSALLSSQTGNRWLKQRIHLLKKIPAISYEFLNIGQTFVSNDDYSAVILKDEQLINAFPQKYRDQFIQKNILLVEKKKALQEENKKTLAEQTSATSAKKESSKGNNALIEQLQKKGYELNTDFTLTQENNGYTLLFASKNDALANLRRAFKDPIKHVKLNCPHPKANVYQLSLSFPAEKLNHIIEIIKTNHALAKPAIYQGAILQATAKQPEASSSQKSAKLIHTEKWRQAIQAIFCESPYIQIAEAKDQSFMITYTESGKDWPLKKAADRHPVPIMATDSNIQQVFVSSLEQLKKKNLATVTYKKAANKQQKIIIVKPIAPQPPDVASMQAQNFDALRKENAKRMPTIYGTQASQKAMPDMEEQAFFKEFHRLCQEKNVHACLIKKDGTVGAIATGKTHTSLDIDYITNCQDEEILKALGLMRNHHARNLTGAALYDGKLINGKPIDLMVTSYQSDNWAQIMAKTADITQCSISIAMHDDGAFYLLDPLRRGLDDYENTLIFPTDPTTLDETIKRDPIRIIRAIKYQLRGNNIDPVYQQALLRWKAEATTFDIKHFSIKLMDEMKKSMASNGSAWAPYLKEYGILNKVYHQHDNDLNISDAAIIAILAGRTFSARAPRGFGVFGTPSPVTARAVQGQPANTAPAAEPSRLAIS